MTVVSLGPAEMAVAALLILASAGLSLATAMGLHRRLVWAALRMALQLISVGYLLRLVFLGDSGLLTMAVLAAMLLAAAGEMTSRAGRRSPGSYAANLVILTLSTVAVTAVALLGLSGGGEVFDARHIVPVFGIILGSALNSASLTMHSLGVQVVQARHEIETRLALGEDIAGAAREQARHAVAAGMIPVVNQMAGAGIITLPGIMSGQILAGQDPGQAALYQIFLMATLLAVSVSCVALTKWLFLRRISDERLRLDRLGGR